MENFPLLVRLQQVNSIETWSGFINIKVLSKFLSVLFSSPSHFLVPARTVPTLADLALTPAVNLL